MAKRKKKQEKLQGDEVKGRPNFILGLREKRIKEIINPKKKNKKLAFNVKV